MNLRDNIAEMLRKGIHPSAAVEVADAILALLPKHYDEVLRLISVDCTCGFGGQHEPSNPNCEMNR